MSNEERNERTPSDQEVETAINYLDNKIVYINDKIIQTNINSPILKIYKKELIQVLTMKKDILLQFLDKKGEKKKIEKVI
jgi:hypothetical protein